MESLALYLLLAFTTLVSGGETWQRAAYDDAGAQGRQPHRRSGADYRYPDRDLAPEGAAASEALKTVAFGERVEFAYGGLNPGAAYRLRLTFVSDGPRVERVEAEGTVLLETVELRKGPPREEEIVLPPALYADGVLVLTFLRISGPNAVVSEIEVLSTDPTPLSAVKPVLHATGKAREALEAELARLQAELARLRGESPA